MVGVITRSLNSISKFQIHRQISSQFFNLKNWFRNRMFSTLLVERPLESNSLSTKFKVNENIQLFIDEPRQIIKDDQTLRLEQETNGKPLLVICSYLAAKERHLAKYAEFYFQHGFDVLVTSITPWQAMWATKAQDVSKDILKFLENNDYYDRMVLHGFSAGGYLWSECMVHMNKNPTKYEKLLGRIKGHIWDSIVFEEEVAFGTSKAFFPNHTFSQWTLQKCLEIHLKIFEKVSTRHHRFALDTFRETLVKSPALMLVSEVDLIGTAASNLSVCNKWKTAGINVTWKCFESSPHVGHFLMYKEEYIELLNNHLKLIHLYKL